MQVLIIGTISTLLAIFFGKGIRKHSVILYVVALVLGTAAFFIGDKIKVTEMFLDGLIGFALLYIIMITGALKKKSTLSKKLMTVRKEYSILGFILLLPHTANYLVDWLNDLTNLGHLSGLVGFIIMIPLFYTSFTVIRKKYKYPVWKKLHRWSYLAYSLILVHLILVAEGRDLVIYIILFTPYIIMKLLKEYKIYNNKKQKAN